MISQKEIITALHNNTCPECNRHYMAATKLHTEDRQYVACYFCSTQWELTLDTWNEHVRICDTYTKKMEEWDADTCPECSHIVDYDYEEKGELVCRCCGKPLADDLFDNEEI